MLQIQLLVKKLLSITIGKFLSELRLYKTFKIRLQNNFNPCVFLLNFAVNIKMKKMNFTVLYLLASSMIRLHPEDGRKIRRICLIGKHI